MRSEQQATLSTIKITSAVRLLSSFVATEEHDNNNGEHNELTLSGDKYVLFYKGRAAMALLRSLRCTANGEAPSNSFCRLLSLRPATTMKQCGQDDRLTVLAHLGSSYDGYINLQMASDGSTITKFR